MAKVSAETVLSANKELSRLESLQAISREAAPLRELPALLERILRTALRQTQSERGLVGLLDPSQTRLEVVRHVGWKLPRPRRAVPSPTMALRDSPFAPVLKQKRAVAGILGRPSNSSPRRKGQEQPFLAAPLRLRGVPLGLLAVACKPRAYSPVEKRLLEALASQATLVLENHRLRQAVKRGGQRLRQRAESSRSEQLRELRDFRQALQEGNQWEALGHLAGTLAHELRQPLSAIHNIAAYLKATVSSSDRRMGENLKRLEQQAGVASQILSNLLQFARSGKPQKVPADLHAVLKNVLERACWPSQVRLEQKLVRRLPLVLADPVQVDRILSNLISNGLESMEGPGTLSIATQAENGQVVVWITDTGCGIPLAHAPKIFEPFFTTKRTGTGLGLALCQQLAEANGGNLAFRSQPGQGTTFELRLPQA